MEAGADCWTRLDRADLEPGSVADAWRAQGRRVVGLFGRCAPRELVVAAGMLPVALRSGRLLRGGEIGGARSRSRHVPDGLRSELSGPAVELLSALLGGELDWVDSLLIGRETESHTKLFYVIRELAQDPEYGARIPPFAFSDVLRLPTRTSAVYNRARLRELAGVIGEWAGAEIGDDALRTAIREEVSLAGQLRELDGLRADGRVLASRAVTARRAAAVLPHAEAAGAIGGCLEGARGARPGTAGPRVFLTGSEPEPALLVRLEEAGLSLVGDDYGWHPEISGDEIDAPPIDWLADRYQFSPVGPARAGLERVADTVTAALAVDADCILQLIAADDLASGWELAELRSMLPTLPVVSIQLDAEAGEDAIREIAGQLQRETAGVKPEKQEHAHG